MVKENKVLSYGEALIYMWNLYVKLTNLLLSLIKFLKIGPTYREQVVNPRHQTPQGRSVAKPGTPLPVEYPSRECKYDIKESNGNMFNQYSRRMSRGGNIQGVAHLQNQNYLVTESLDLKFKMKRMAIKITIIVKTIMMKIMMK